MGLPPGTRIGPYEILSALGAGGMGEVYRARDTKLNRDVALKLLLHAVANDADRLARFTREAHVLASLNHPHIAAIYGLEDSDGRKALILELVEGPTLAHRLARGAIPLDEALPIARQIAEALDAAHQQGIIHRDLKPANIKVRTDGTVKVLDFGLAKAIEPVGSSPELSQSPTITSPAMTHAGMILGTAAYMSPEQAKGRGQDKRSDLWSFGCVFFEMLTGRRLFERDDVAETLAAVLTADVPWQHLPGSLTSGVRQALSACLQRDPKQRLRDAGDLLLLLTGALDNKAQDDQLLPKSRRHVWQRPGAIAALVMALAISWIFIGWQFRRAQNVEPRHPVRLSIAIPPTHDLEVAPRSPGIALSPDGRSVVYAARQGGTSQLYRRPLDQVSATAIPGTEGASMPFFSPDGGWIGFFSEEGAIKKVAVAGGEAVTLGTPVRPGAASWGGDTIVFAATNILGQTISQLPARGGEAKPVTMLKAGDVAHWMPEMLPGGTSVLFSSSPDQKIHVISLDTGEEKTLVDGVWPRYSASGHLIFLRDTALWAAPFDADRRTLTGPPVRLLDGVLSAPAIAADGTMTYVSGVPRRIQLVWVDRHGSDTPVDVDPADFGSVVLSPDGRRLAVSRGATSFGGSDIWVYDLERKTSNRLTPSGLSVFPLWTPDGKSIVYSAAGDGQRNLFRRAADGTGSAQRLTNSQYQQSPWAWSPDGKTIVLQELREQTQWDIARVPAEGGAESMLVDAPDTQLNPVVSPDGRWIAYGSSVTGTPQLEVRPFPNTNDHRWQVSSHGGCPLWSRDGHELFYRDGSSVMRVTVASGPEFRPGLPERLFSWSTCANGTEKNWDIAPDGRFFMKKVLPAEYSVNVVLNWVDELKARVPTR